MEAVGDLEGLDGADGVVVGFSVKPKMPAASEMSVLWPSSTSLASTTTRLSIRVPSSTRPKRSFSAGSVKR